MVPDKQNVRAAYPKDKLEFKFVLSPIKKTKICWKSWPGRWAMGPLLAKPLERITEIEPT